MVPFTPCSIEQGRIYLVMIGHLDIKIVMVSVSAFARKTDEGREFLSLAIGQQSYAYIGTNTLTSASGARALSATVWICTTCRSWQQWEAGDRRMHPAFWELFQRKSETVLPVLKEIEMTITTKAGRRLAHEQALASTRIESHVPTPDFLADCEAVIEGMMTREQARAASLARALAKDKAVAAAAATADAA
jgi:hypothetical protein